MDARLSYAENQFPGGWAERFLARYAALAGAVLAGAADRPVTALLAQPDLAPA